MRPGLGYKLCGTGTPAATSSASPHPPSAPAYSKRVFRLQAAVCAAALSLFAASPEYRQAVPGYRFQFPRDHFNHPEFRTEWWYYTGNVRSTDGRRYGFELVFFRQAQRRGPSDNPSAWRVDDLYLAHLALTDIAGKRFHYYKRLNRAGPGIAGASIEQARIWNGNWESKWDVQTGAQTLSATAEDIRFNLKLNPRKPPVINGENGVSQKAEGLGKASYYVSFPLLGVEGTLNGLPVAGTAWMDMSGSRTSWSRRRSVGTGSARNSATTPKSCSSRFVARTAASTPIPPGRILTRAAARLT